MERMTPNKEINSTSGDTSVAVLIATAETSNFFITNL
jgi:hypothetical protein